MSWRACIILTLLAVARGDYTPSTPGSGYTTPGVNAPSDSLHNPPATYSAPTPLPYTTAVVHARPSTPTTPPVTTVSTPSGNNPYSQIDASGNNGYSHPWSPYSPLHQQLSPGFISQYYKQPPYAFPYPQQHPAPSIPLNHPAFQPHSCATPNNPPYQPQQPHIQSTLFQVPNPLSFLNGFVSPNSFSALVHPPGQRGPLPSPGYYSPNPPTPSSQPLFSVGYTPSVSRPSPYNVH